MAPWRVVLAVVALGIVTPAVADPIPEGLAEQSVMLGQNQMAAFTYRPAQCPQPSLLLLFHGNGGAQHYRDYARVLADKTCMIVVAPRFDKKRFSGADYQRGGIVRKREVLPASDWTSMSSPISPHGPARKPEFKTIICSVIPLARSFSVASRPFCRRKPNAL